MTEDVADPDTLDRAEVMAKVKAATRSLRSMGGYFDAVAASIEGAFHAFVHHGMAQPETAGPRDETADNIDPATGQRLSVQTSRYATPATPEPNSSAGPSRPAADERGEAADPAWSAAEPPKPPGAQS